MEGQSNHQAVSTAYYKPQFANEEQATQKVEGELDASIFLAYTAQEIDEKLSGLETDLWKKVVNALGPAMRDELLKNYVSEIEAQYLPRLVALEEAVRKLQEKEA